MGSSSHLHEDNGNGALFPVPVGDGKGDAFTFFVNPDDNELSRLSLLGYIGCSNLEKVSVRYQVFS